MVLQWMDFVGDRARYGVSMIANGTIERKKTMDASMQPNERKTATLDGGSEQIESSRNKSHSIRTTRAYIQYICEREIFFFS